MRQSAIIIEAYHSFPTDAEPGALHTSDHIGALKPATPVAYEIDMVLQSARRYAHLQLLNAAQVG